MNKPEPSTLNKDKTSRYSGENFCILRCFRLMMLIVYLPVNTVVAVLALAFDTFALVLTASKTARHVQDMRRFKQKHTVAELLLRDGRIGLSHVLRGDAHKQFACQGILYYMCGQDLSFKGNRG